MDSKTRFVMGKPIPEGQGRKLHNGPWAMHYLLQSPERVRRFAACYHALAVAPRAWRRRAGR